MLVQALLSEHGMSERRASQASGVARSTLRYRPAARDDSGVITSIRAHMALNAYRTEVLDCYVFESLQEVQDMTADCLHRYKHHRPHESLCRIPTLEYRVKLFPNLYL